MTYNDVFGGSPVQPADVAYRAVTLAANTTLVWPDSGLDTSDVASRIMEVTATSNGLTLTMPPADEVSTGQDALIRNVGATSFTIAANDGSSIIFLSPGIAVYIYIVDNSTAAGTWSTVTYGAGTSAADAASLAGNGLSASGSTLILDVDATTLVADYTVQIADRAKAFNWNTGAGTLTLPAVGTAGNGFIFLVRNIGTGSLSIDPNGSEQINGAATETLNPEDSCIVICTGSAWFTYGLGRNSDFAYTLLNLDVSGSTDVTLTNAQAGNPVQRYYGTLTGNINVIVPSAVSQWTIHNDTSGAFSLTVKTAAGTGVAITQGDRRILYSDGTNVYLSDDGTAAVATTFPDGSATNPSIAFTSDPDTGFYRPAANELGIATNGIQRVVVSSSGLNVTSGLVRENGVSVTSKQLAYAIIFGG